MKNKCTLIIIVMLFVLSCNAQSVIPSKKWIDKDTCWIFNSFHSIGFADGDTIVENKSYQLALPKSIIRYRETADKALFVLKNNQYIFVKQTFLDTTASEEDQIDIDDFISYFNNLLTNKDKRIISKTKRKNKIRKHYHMKMKDRFDILLYNFKEQELKKMIFMIKSESTI